jgi:hypothetical protein
VPSTRGGDRPLPIGIRLDQAGINGKAFTPDQTLGDAARHHILEQVSEEVALREAAMPVLRERRVVWNLALQTQPAKPTVGQIEMTSSQRRRSDRIP